MEVDEWIERASSRFENWKKVFKELGEYLFSEVSSTFAFDFPQRAKKKPFVEVGNHFFSVRKCKHIGTISERVYVGVRREARGFVAERKTTRLDWLAIAMFFDPSEFLDDGYVGSREIYHLCGSRMCFSPLHLVWETQSMQEARKGCLAHIHDCQHWPKCVVLDAQASAPKYTTRAGAKGL